MSTWRHRLGLRCRERKSSLATGAVDAMTQVSASSKRLRATGVANKVTSPQFAKPRARLQLTEGGNGASDLISGDKLVGLNGWKRRWRIMMPCLCLSFVVTLLNLLSWLPCPLKALTHGIYAINKLPRQLPRSSDVLYTAGARPDAAYAPYALRNNLL